ncbi:MAG: protein translocase subunit SecF [Candidatus Aminicenantes bacterium]|nr:protein translocase subunit SecF [Candidatus Aminicenantes bacterium]
MQFLKKTNIDFMKYKYLALILSGIIILVGILNISVGKGLNYGIDFAGGALVRVIFRDIVPISEVRNALNTAGLENSRIQHMGSSEREFIIRAMPESEAEEQDIEAHEMLASLVVDTLRGTDENAEIARGKTDLNSIDVNGLNVLLQAEYPEQAAVVAQNIITLRNSPEMLGIIQDFTQLEQVESLTPEIGNTLKEKTYLSRIAVLSKESVGPQVGKDLRRRATQATVWALIGMLIYIGLRFQLAYGVAAIVTLGHDVLVVIGIFSLTQRELNLPVIAAILTLVGYSLNDTIVIFDRVRDNLKTMRKQSFLQVLNSSINQTLSRTIITSGTTFLTVLSLFLFGGQVINDFAFLIMIGVVIGTYSSIYMSCSMLYFWKKLFKPKKGLGK